MTTQTMQTHTEQLSVGAHTHYPLSRTALATRSLVAVERLRDRGSSADYGRALSRHFEQFTPARVCPLR